MLDTLTAPAASVATPCIKQLKGFYWGEYTRPDGFVIATEATRSKAIATRRLQGIEATA